LIGSVRIALDSKTWLPLRVEIWSKNDPSTPAFSVGFTSISLKAPGASTFAFTKPPRASVQPFAFSGSESPQDGASSAQHSSADETVGKDWTSVLVEKLSSASTSSSQPPTGQSCMAIKHDSDTGATTRTKVSCVAPPEADSLSQTIDQYATKVAQGHLLTTALASVLVTNDNRLLVGAVTPQYLEQLASSGAGQ
jgi:hypothetical protein